MKAYNDDPAIKAEFLRLAAEHEAEDRLRPGRYWQMVDGQWKGCAVGCTIRSWETMCGTWFEDDPVNNHFRYEAFGVPEAVAVLEDDIFERLPPGRQRTWPREFLAAIPVGADLGYVADLFRAREGDVCPYTPTPMQADALLALLRAAGTEAGDR